MIDIYTDEVMPKVPEGDYFKIRGLAFVSTLMIVATMLQVDC